MINLFECKIRYEKTMENGLYRKVTEPYIVDALSFTEAEARIIEEITPFISGEFTVADISPRKFSEVVSTPGDESADKWYSVKMCFLSLDEKSGDEKRIPTTILVQASSTTHADKRTHEHMKVTMCDYIIDTVKETKIMDVFLYKPETES